MARQVERSSGLATRVVIGLVVLVVAWLAIRAVLGFLFSLIRIALFVVLFGIVAWVVLIGPPDGRGS